MDYYYKLLCFKLLKTNKKKKKKIIETKLVSLKILTVLPNTGH